MSSKKPGAIRLQKEHMQICKRKSLDNFLAHPDPNNIFRWYYVIWGLKDCDYEGGFYFGTIIFPKEYPLKPPGIEMITPNGRFEVNKRICMSMSDFHPESWNPLWNVQTIVMGLISFLCSDERTTGCIITSSAEKRLHARSSLAFNKKRAKF